MAATLVPASTCACGDGGPLSYAIALPAEAGAGQEFYSRSPVGAGQPVSCTLEPGDAAVYVLRR